MTRTSLAYFQQQYAQHPDPWGFDARWYERRKYQLTVAALPRQHYARAFEPGCANGALTELLAPRCDELIATELVPAVCARARTRLAKHRHVDVRDLAIPEQWPDGKFDLVVLSELLYYFDAPGLAAIIARLDGCLVDGAHVVAVHWRGATDYPLAGDAVHDALGKHARWQRLAAHRETDFALDVFEARA